MTVEIVRLDGPTFDATIPDLARILADAVAGGASVGFTAPLTEEAAATWWRTLEPDVLAGRVVVVVARLDRHIVGTAQLRLAQLPNARHRAEVAKVLVHRTVRRRGIATALMREIEDVARRDGRTLLVLDTTTGSDAEHLYDTLGWIRLAEIPGYAALPSGELKPTTIYYRVLPP